MTFPPLNKLEGITSICVIHQPRFSVFNCFSQLLLLAPGGKMVYLDKTSEVQEYLIRLGFKYPLGENTADWMLDVVAGTCQRFSSLGVLDEHFAIEDLVEEWKKERENRYRDIVPKGLTRAESIAVLQRLTGMPTDGKSENLYENLRNVKGECARASV